MIAKLSLSRLFVLRIVVGVLLDVAEQVFLSLLLLVENYPAVFIGFMCWFAYVYVDLLLLCLSGIHASVDEKYNNLI